MATTAIIPIHAGKGRPIAAALKISVDYIKNPAKTEAGQWVTAYGCDPLIADDEFLFSKNRYAAITGRDQGKHDVLAYHLRISFKPGETDAETANRIAYELAMKLTKGRNAFVCATHTDKAHVHTHVVINSTNLDCMGKFRNIKNSAFAVRNIADHLCIENRLSIVEKPEPSRGSYGQWEGDAKPATGRDKLRELIDESLFVGSSMEDFLIKLKKAGVEIKFGKQFSFRPPGSKRFFRQDTLGDDYSLEALKERFSGKRDVVKTEKAIAAPTPRMPKLLIDIEAKLHKAYSPGFEHYARIYNLKEMARTLIFLQENGVGTYEELNEKIRTMGNEHDSRSVRLKEIEARQAEIKELQKQIGTYSKTKDKFNEHRRQKKYKQTWWEKVRKETHPAEVYYQANTADIILCQAAKKYFDEHGYGKNKKIPTIQSLKEEYAKLGEEKRQLSDGYTKLRGDVIALELARQNVDMFLDESREQRLLERLNTRARGAR